jgi:hypothetical protein
MQYSYRRLNEPAVWTTHRPNEPAVWTTHRLDELQVRMNLHAGGASGKDDSPPSCAINMDDCPV